MTLPMKLDEERVVKLLRETDMTMSMIGKRFGVHRNRIMDVNKKFKVRVKKGKE